MKELHKALRRSFQKENTFVGPLLLGLKVELRHLRFRIGTVNETPLFVLGNQKSGTTVIASLLATHTGLSPLLDFNYRSGEELLDIHQGALTMEQFVKKHRQQFSHDLIKEPNLTFLLPGLQRRFPRARYVMIVRDPRDNIRSFLNRLNLPGNCERIDPTAYDGIISIWRKALCNFGLNIPGGTYIERLAHRWRRVAETYHQNDSEMLLVRYEDFCRCKEETIRALARNLDLAPQNDIADKVDRQYQPRGNRDVSWDSFFGAANLKRIGDICGEAMETLGYEPSS